MVVAVAHRYRGCLLGLAAGDAYGAPYEFSESRVTPTDSITGGGPHDLQPGQWTDDTSMALCLAESLIEKKGFDPADQLGRYVDWYLRGHMSSTGTCFGIGNTTHSALNHYIKTRKLWGRPSDVTGEGNGSIMRLAPVSNVLCKEFDASSGNVTRKLDYHARACGSSRCVPVPGCDHCGNPAGNGQDCGFT